MAGEVKRSLEVIYPSNPHFELREVSGCEFR